MQMRLFHFHRADENVDDLKIFLKQINNECHVTNQKLFSVHHLSY